MKTDRKKAKKLKTLSKFIFITTFTVLTVLMGISAKNFLEDNTSDSVIHDPSFRTEIVDSDQLKYIIDIPITIENSGYFRIGQSEIRIWFSNETETLEILFIIPEIKSGETLDTNLTYTIEFSNLEDFTEYEIFMTSVNKFQFRFDLLYFLFPITIEGEFSDFNFEEEA